ncbi:hypothetical protein [Actinoplanes subtropicus]|uniref:hypothetical protein n=1 Tax=Actinoplanes subtropicus TaxID=543632 RepID=UPI0004C3AB80|nr:hypothetical protein [Actinoplanes subtropicus]
MAALSATTPTRGGTTTSGSAVASTDTIARTLLGSRGAYLEIINGNASSDTVSISDASVSNTGAAATAGGGAVAASTSKIFSIHPQQADPSTGNVTVTHSVTSTVTYKLYPLG